MNDLPSSPAPSVDNAETPTMPKKKSRFWQSFWLSFLVVSLVAAWYSYYVPSNNIAWAGDYGAAQQMAKDTGKPVILYFTGTWCVPCRIMKRQVWADEEVMAAVNKRFIPVAIDVDNPEYADLMNHYNVAGPPVTIVTDPQGHALDWRAGGIGKAEFLKLLNAADPA